jgi:hypothetical protein
MGLRQLVRVTRMLDLGAVVRRFMRDRDIMRMVLPHRRGADEDETSISSQFGASCSIDRPCTQISHPRSQPADQLVDVIAERTAERHSAFDAFGDNLPAAVRLFAGTDRCFPAPSRRSIPFRGKT